MVKAINEAANKMLYEVSENENLSKRVVEKSKKIFGNFSPNHYDSVYNHVLKEGLLK